MNRGGQAFLISAVILVTILIAFITITNFSKKTTFSTFPFIAEEIQIESEKVMDYSLANQDNSVVDDFTKKASIYVGEETDIYFIEDSSGTLDCYKWKGNSKIQCDDFTESDDLIILTIDQIDYNFPLSKGKHFYLVMIKESEEEKYVFTNK